MMNTGTFRKALLSLLVIFYWGAGSVVFAENAKQMILMETMPVPAVLESSRSFQHALQELAMWN